jgi:hypothetical protein
MGLVASTIPNLVGGISQQPPALRLTTACENMENTWPSIVSGLQKRPPTTHLANVGSALSAGSTGYLIERNESYRFLAVLQNGDLKVLDLNTGEFQTVTFPNGKAYLNAASPVDDFRFVTFGDFTFISNRNVVVETIPVTETTLAATQLRLNPTAMATVYVTQSIGNAYYSVYVDNVLKAEYLTPSGASGSDPIPDTSVIAGELRDDLVAAGYTVIKTGSTLTITNFPANGTLQSQGGSGDKSIRVFIRDVQSFSDLPPTSPEGRIVRVAGDLETFGDDYYVVFEKGIWRETLDWNQGETFDTATMPHVLIREANGSWTFKRHVWKGRSVGDTESARNPSFAGTTINDIFVFTNRLGILADENICLSESDNFENFYRSTTAQLLDSDVIDVAVLHNNVDIIYHAIPFNRDLLLMSEKNQFRFSYQNFLGQKSVQIQYSTSFNCSTRVRPVNVGASVYFVDDRADYSFTKLYEFFPKDNATVDDADEASAPIPELVPNDIRFMAASNRAKAILLNSTKDPSSLFVYKYFWSGDRKIQNAWTKWTFADCNRIYWAGFSGIFLYILVERPFGVTLERMRLDEDVFDTDVNYELLLDRRVNIAPSNITYNASLDTTVITLPYGTGGTPEVVSSNLEDGVLGIRNESVVTNSTTLSVKGDLRGFTVTVGIPYTKFFEFSTLFVKQQKGQGEVVVTDGRLQLRYLSIQYDNTAFFKAVVKTPGRADQESTFVGAVLGSFNVGRQPFATGKYRLPVMAENLKARIQIVNDSPFPSSFGSAEWQAVWSPKSRQRL